MWFVRLKPGGLTLSLSSRLAFGLFKSMNRFLKIQFLPVNSLICRMNNIKSSPFLWILIALVFSGNFTGTAGEVADPDPQRFANDIEKFEKQDQETPFCSGGTLFIGSSSIRKWDLSRYFPGMRAINRGFGGSHLSDCNYYSDRILFPYKPGRIVIYEGDNDISSGKTSCQVLEDFKLLFDKIRRELPEAEVYFIAIKPSVSRWQLWPEMNQTNLDIRRVIEEYNQSSDLYHFVDVASPMLNEKGEITSEWFVKDGLHLNEQGYELWTRILMSVMRREN